MTVHWWQSFIKRLKNSNFLSILKTAFGQSFFVSVYLHQFKKIALKQMSKFFKKQLLFTTKLKFLSTKSASCNHSKRYKNVDKFSIASTD